MSRRLKVTPQNYPAIKRAAQTERFEEVGQKFGISHATVSYIYHSKTYEGYRNRNKRTLPPTTLQDDIQALTRELKLLRLSKNKKWWRK